MTRHDTRAHIRALVVDDDPAWQQILSEILTDAGLEVEVAGSPEDAVAALRSKLHRLAVVDLSLCDSGVPNQEGLAILDAVRRLDPGCTSILLTGYATVDIAVSALTHHGAYTCLQKDTFRRARFRELLRQVLAAAPRPEDAEASPVGQAVEPAAALTEAPSTPRPGGPAVLLVEDDAGWRSILGQLLIEAGFRVRACSSYGEALGYVRREGYKLAVVDLSLANSLVPEGNRDGYQVLSWAHSAGIPAIVVSGWAASTDVERAYAEHGIFAYLEKQAFDRRSFIGLAREAVGRSQDLPEDLRSLTRRERDVLVLVAQGLTNKDIAGALVVSPNTIKRYLKSIFEKLDVDTRAAAAAKAIRAGLAGEGMRSANNAGTTREHADASARGMARTGRQDVN